MNKHPSRWTKLIQPQETGPVFRSLTDPITRASTVVFDSVEKLRKRDWRDRSQYSYGLQATPTTRRLEQQLAGIDEVSHALLYPSGLSAICMTMMALLEAGDRLLLPRNSYAPTLEMARFMSRRSGVKFSIYDPQDLSTLDFTENTRLVWVETPGSITMEVADLPAIAALAHAHGALVAVDATWSAGIALPVFNLGADLSVQALTKYQSGGSDVMMGVVTTADDAIHDKLFQTRTIFGIGVSPEDCYLILRSLPHLRLRYLAQDQSARKIAAWLGKQPFIAQVLHPALEGCPGHELWRRDFSAAASLFSVLFRDDIPQPEIDRSVESLKLFRLGVSWGGTASLVVPYTKSQMRADYHRQAGPVRFYIGLEDADDLIADLAQAFTP